MPDEFPTLEVAIAVGVAALVIRTLLVISATRRVPLFALELTRLLAKGERAQALAACDDVEAPALAQSARELITLLGDPPFRASAGEELAAARSELAARLARRAQSARARDLILLGVMAGATAFAWLSHVNPSSWFYGLCATVSLLFAIGFVLRSTLAARVSTEFSRIADALGASLSADAGDERQRPSLHSLDGACRACGETTFLIVPASALGATLAALSVNELRVCKNCGFVQGEVSELEALATATLSEVSVPDKADSEAPSDDLEHDG
ncbi:MAG TPA: hypothetical protein VGI10_12005 [Polyangiaceae bacterium]